MEIVTPTPADAVAIANVSLDSNADDPVARAVLKTPTPAAHELRQWWAETYVKDWDNAMRRVVKDSVTGEIVSALTYAFVPTQMGETWKSTPAPLLPPAHLWHHDRSVAAQTAHFKQRIKHMGAGAFIHLKGLYTAPEFMHRGAGSLLVKHVADQADKYNLPVFLLSSATGRALYARHGFKEVEAVDVVSEPTLVTNWSMIRPTPHPDQPSSVPARPLKPVRVVPMESTIEEVREFWSNEEAAIEAEPLIDLAFGGVSSEGADVRDAQTLEQVKKPDEFLFEKAIDQDTGEPLGFSKWVIITDPSKSPWEDNPWSPGCHVKLCEAVFGELRRQRFEYFRKRKQPYFYMESLMVLPNAQRRGVGSALLRSGLKLADEKGWPAFIAASPVGSGLYRKFGWKDFSSVTVNLKDYGGPDHVDTTLAFLRPVDAKEVPRAEIAS